MKYFLLSLLVLSFNSFANAPDLNCTSVDPTIDFSFSTQVTATPEINFAHVNGVINYDSVEYNLFDGLFVHHSDDPNTWLPGLIILNNPSEKSRLTVKYEQLTYKNGHAYFCSDRTDIPAKLLCRNGVLINCH